jgi:hypothetical protein
VERREEIAAQRERPAAFGLKTLDACPGFASSPENLARINLRLQIHRFHAILRPPTGRWRKGREVTKSRLRWPDRIATS